MLYKKIILNFIEENKFDGFLCPIYNQKVLSLLGPRTKYFERHFFVIQKAIKKASVLVSKC